MDTITDKAIWSATKAWYLSHTHVGANWELLSDTERDAVRVEYLEWKDRQPKSAHQLTAELRKARIDNGILQRKLDAALAKIAQYEASRELAAAMAEDAEGVCP